MSAAWVARGSITSCSVTTSSWCCRRPARSDVRRPHRQAVAAAVALAYGRASRVESMTTTGLRHGNFSLSIASGDALDVREFTVRERMSALFSVSVVAVSENPDIDFEA